MKGLELIGSQSVGKQPASCGATCVCHELEPATPGTLRVVAREKILGRISGRPIGVDRREGITHIFSQEDDGTLMLSISLTDSNEVVGEPQELGRVESRIVQGACTGDFLVFRDEEGVLYYALYDEPGYHWLGALPQAPDCTLIPADIISSTVVIPAVSFKGTITDLREGIDEENRRRVGEALNESLTSAVEKMRRSGYRALPVTVRVAWRLLDGSLLHVSEPKTLSGLVPLPGSERVNLQLEYSDKGYTGTSAGSMQVDFYKLKVKPASAIPASWQGIMKGVEVWVSEPGEWLLPGELPLMVQQSSTGSTVNRLSCTFRLLSDAEILADMLSQPMRRQLSTETWNEELYVPADEFAPADEQMSGQQVPPASEMRFIEKADCLLSYGGFLHLSRGEDVRTSERGKPFITKSVTRGVGGVVKHMWPNLSGGGAYTRQYIYLATDYGVIGITHDSTGSHTNCRTIWPGTITDARKGVASPTGLIACSSEGEVVRIHEARFTTLLRQVKGVESVAYSRAFSQIMLMNEISGITLCEAAELQAFTRNFTCEMLDGCTWRSIGFKTDRNSVSTLYDLNERDASDLPTAIYEGDIPVPPGKKLAERLCLRLSGSGVGATVTLSVGLDEGIEGEMKVIGKGKVSGNVKSNAHIFLPRLRSRHKLKYRLRVSGRFSTLSDPKWE